MTICKFFLLIKLKLHFFSVQSDKLLRTRSNHLDTDWEHQWDEGTQDQMKI